MLIMKSTFRALQVVLAFIVGIVGMNSSTNSTREIADLEDFVEQLVNVSSAKNETQSFHKGGENLHNDSTTQAITVGGFEHDDHREGDHDDDDQEDDDQSHKDHEDEGEYYYAFDKHVSLNVYLFFVYFVLIFGLSGNVTLFVFMQLRFPSVSYSIYLRFLAVLDCLVLIFTCTEDILDYQYGRIGDLTEIGDWFCKIWVFLSSFSKLLSPWFVVVFSFDRCVAVVFPFKRHVFGTVKTALCISVSLICIGCVEGIPALVLFRALSDEEETECRVTEDFMEYHVYVSVRTIFLEAILPCILIFILNVSIVIAINRSRKFRRSSSSADGKRSNQDNKITISLVTVSLMAFFTLTPVSLVEMIEYFWDEHESSSTLPEIIENIFHTWKIFNLVRLFNFGQNFYILMITSQTYRQEFVSMLPCIKRVNNKGQRQATQSTDDTH